MRFRAFRHGFGPFGFGRRFGHSFGPFDFRFDWQGPSDWPGGARRRGRREIANEQPQEAERFD